MGVAALDEQILYGELGVNAEYLIDHAFGREPVTIAEIQAYRPRANSISSGQVLARAYSYEEAYTVLREMVDAAVLDLVQKQQVTSSISLFVSYASERAQVRRLDASGTAQYRDNCGKLRSSTSDIVPRASVDEQIPRRAPKPRFGGSERALVREAQTVDGVFVNEHGKRPRGGYTALFAHSNASRRLGVRTNSFKKIMAAFDELWAQTVDPKRPVKRINLGFGDLLPEEFATVDLFSDHEADEREHDLARAMNAVKRKFGKNALLKGTSFTEGATARERNEQVGDIMPRSQSLMDAPGTNTPSRTANGRTRADRAAQFMPFAALTGYYELARAQERTSEPRREITDEMAAELSRKILSIRRGDLVCVTYYKDDGYTDLVDIVEQVEEPLRQLKVKSARIPFDDIYEIELRGRP